MLIRWRVMRHPHSRPSLFCSFPKKIHLKIKIIKKTTMGATLSRSATYLWQAGWWVGRYVLIYTSITPTKALVTSTIVRYRIQHLIDSLKTIPEFLTNIEDTIRMYICHLYFFFRKIMFCKWSWETQKKNCLAIDPCVV